MILLVDVNHPGSQEDIVSNWEPAHILVEDAVSGAKIAPCPPALAVARLPLCLWWVEEPVRSQLAVLWYSLNPLFCELARLHIRAFHGKVLLFFFFFSLWRSHSLGCYLMLAPSDCPQGVQAWSLP